MRSKRYTRTPFYSIVAAAALFLTGCSSSLEVKASKISGLSDFNLKLNFGPAMVSAIHAITGNDNDDVPLITQEDLNVAGNLGQVSTLKLTESTGKSVSFSGSVVSGSIVSRTENALSINLTRENLKVFYDGLNEEARLYIDLLMAPVFTGEEMLADEYVEFLGAIYGEELAKEISQAYLNINLSNLSGSKCSEYSISLVELLTGTMKNNVFTVRL